MAIDDALITRLLGLSERRVELEHLLAAPETAKDSVRLRELSREYSRLEPLTRTLEEHRSLLLRRRECEQLARDPEMRELAEDDLKQIDQHLSEVEDQLTAFLLPDDEQSERPVFLEVRAGTGGDEAALFAGNLFRMYHRFAERRGLAVELVSSSVGEHGGYKEVIARIQGHGVYGLLRYESGTHRVQRVPETEAQGRIHTSACTVAVLPEVDEVEDVDLDPSDLEISTFRASGAGGQHVNKTDSAIRIVHKPTGLVVECQDERSQHKNRARAMSLLAARLKQAEVERQQAEIAAERRSQVGSGDRSQRIRTYNFPQGRLTDHRIGLTLYQLEQIMDGDLEPVISPLRQAHRTEQLASLRHQH